MADPIKKYLARLESSRFHLFSQYMGVTYPILRGDQIGSGGPTVHVPQRSSDLCEISHPPSFGSVCPTSSNNGCGCLACWYPCWQVGMLLVCTVQFIITFPAARRAAGFEATELDGFVPTWDLRWFFIACVWIALPTAIVMTFTVSTVALGPVVAVGGGGVPDAPFLGSWEWSTGDRHSVLPREPFSDMCGCGRQARPAIRDRPLWKQASSSRAIRFGSIGNFHSANDANTAPCRQADQPVSSSSTLPYIPASAAASSASIPVATVQVESDQPPTAAPTDANESPGGDVQVQLQPLRRSTAPASAVACTQTSAGHETRRQQATADPFRQYVQCKRAEWHARLAPEPDPAAGCCSCLASCLSCACFDARGSNTGNRVSPRQSKSDPVTGRHSASMSTPGATELPPTGHSMPIQLSTDASYNERRAGDEPLSTGGDTGTACGTLPPEAFVEPRDSALQDHLAVGPFVGAMSCLMQNANWKAAGRHESRREPTRCGLHAVPSAREWAKPVLRTGLYCLDMLPPEAISSSGEIFAAVLLVLFAIPVGMDLVSQATSGGVGADGLLVTVLFFAPASSLIFGIYWVYVSFSFMLAATSRQRGLVELLAALRAPAHDVSDEFEQAELVQSQVPDQDADQTGLRRRHSPPNSSQEAVQSPAGAQPKASTQPGAISQGQLPPWLAQTAFELALDRQGELRRCVAFYSHAVGALYGACAGLLVLVGVSFAVVAVGLDSGVAAYVFVFGVMFEIVACLMLLLPAGVSRGMKAAMLAVMRAPHGSALEWTVRRNESRVASLLYSSDMMDAVTIFGTPVTPGFVFRVFSVIGTVALVLARFIGGEENPLAN